MFVNLIYFSIKFLVVFLSPPIMNVPKVIVLGTMVIKTMHHFVRNDRSKPTIIINGISIFFIKNIMDNTAWYINDISMRIIIGINNERIHIIIGRYQCPIDRFINEIH